MKIKSITEAFSMQPNYFRVCVHDHKHADECIKNIESNIIWQGPNDQSEVYQGYNFDDKMIFQYIAKSVNVHYFP